MASWGDRSGREATKFARFLSVLILGIAMTGILAGCTGAGGSDGASPTGTGGEDGSGSPGGTSGEGGPGSPGGTSGEGGPGSPGGQGGEGSPGTGGSAENQVILQSSIIKAREHLFDGVLTYQPLEPIPVEDTRQFRVTLVAVVEGTEFPRIPPGDVVGSRELQVGGVEEAKLSGPPGKVDISPVGSTRRLIGQVGDQATWAWNITPKQPGDYTLDLVITTYQGTTENPLYIINPPIPIDLSVRNTWPHFLNAMKAWIIAFSTFVGAVAVILTFFREQLFGKKDKNE
jgi:hypothetical protein